ncbi:P-loop containing nucleoside triphosphate hydrolase protein [Thamnocephalis sphaerospora]|uniref:RNA helicase n=1 Tax=Thamnocephalis sphaerospora TaxID=78915 RepID=A0A4P9XJ97_9FUNG|nr:P-loop containing nucleoside triphosphate hydrolase protein [Thamnocephalis sphaerospora]|eukprot:RKP05824.1 P-loop containing nucleoside triphosphate hydrolase protein [Thamnocephalis sphaerospora]
MQVEEVDPLDAFMVGVSAEVDELSRQDSHRMQGIATEAPSASSEAQTDAHAGPADDSDNEDAGVGSDPEDILALAAKMTAKRKDIAQVDHSKMNYEEFRKDFYMEPPELAEMSAEEVDLLRASLDGVKIRGVRPPKPVKRWTHCGFPAACYDVIRKLGYTAPTPIQAQGIPAILGGRDVIGIAKTGSGKTMAFLLPMFRHIKDQRPLRVMEGPVALIMTPTRELAVQIHRDCKPFLKVLNLRAVCAYGGAPIKDQIADLKRGAEIVVCTPGRMIDLLCANAGRLLNLARVTYLVLDEADRMFDMGFEPQVMKIVNNIRPNRQTVLFSATFPRQMEALARKVLRKPLEITVGGRSVVCDDVEQIVEVRDDQTKFVRLLEILGLRYNENPDLRTLIFVDRQEAADNLLRDLMRRGYSSLSLHGGKDQMDRDSTISDFKAGVVPILVATSVAARGLDVKMLGLVVNYDCPNHMEDYVHRVGRTGRAGNKGTAYTFITPEQDRYAVDIVKALCLSKAHVPDDLQKMADEFLTKVKAGKAYKAGSGFSGKGLERLDQERDMVKKIQKKAGIRFGQTDGNESDDDIAAEIESKIKTTSGGTTNAEPATAAALPALPAASAGLSGDALEALRRAQQRAAMVNSSIAASSADASGSTAGAKPKLQSLAAFSFEIEINDYPRKARWRVTSKDEISRLTEQTGVAITTRGSFCEPGKTLPPGERKLHLLVEADSEMAIELAKREIKQMLVDATVASMEAEARAGPSGRYSVV